MITDKEVCRFLEHKPGEGLLYYRIVEFLMQHGLYIDEQLEKEKFEKSIVDIWNSFSDKVKQEMKNKFELGKLSKKVYKVLKKNNLI